MTYQTPPVDNGLRPWTPTLKFGNAAVGLTYTDQSGYYKIQGGIIYLTGGFTINSKGSSSGTATLQGLPFPIRSTIPTVAGISITPLYNGMTLDVDKYATALYDNTNNNFILQQSLNFIPISLNENNFSSGSQVIITFSYPY